MTTELLERHGALAVLADHLALASRGDGRLVLLRGEAGVGKTTVLEAFAAHARSSAGVLMGFCDPLSTPPPLGPLVDMAPELGEPVQQELALSSGGSDGLAGVCRAVMDALGVGGPKVLIFEDIHWADEATLDLLSLLARRIAGQAALLVASYRDDEIGPTHPLRALLGHLAAVPAVHRLVIEPFSPAGVARMAAGRRFDVDELYRITGGNPFFVTEVLATGGEGIPATVADVVAGRLSSVSPVARLVAEVVAVIGAPAPLPMLATLVEGAGAAVAELLGAGVLHPTNDGVGFRHELARQAALETIPPFARAGLHARVLAMLRADAVMREDSALLAHHAEAAGDAEAVLTYAPSAAARAVALGAHREAAAHYSRALRFGSSPLGSSPLGSLLPPERRAALLEGLARTGFVAGQLPEAMTAMQEAIELRQELGDRLRESADLRWWSWALWPSGRCAEARWAGRRAVRVLDGLAPSPELAWAYVNLCQLAAYDQRGISATADLARRAVSLGEQFEDPEIVCQAEFHLAAARYACADDDGSDGSGWSEMVAVRADTFAAGLIEPAAFMAMLMGWLAEVHRDVERAREAFDLLETHSLGRDILLYLMCGRGFHTLGLLRRGAWDEAADLATSVLEHPSAPPGARILPLVVSALILARRGEPGGWPLLDEATAAFEPAGYALLVNAARAEAAWLDGDHSRARAEAERGLEAATEHVDPWILGELARWSWMSGGPAPAVRVAVPFARELAGDWQGAASLWEQQGFHYDAGIARLAGDVPAVTQALTTFESMGASHAATIARSRLRAQGAVVGIRGPRSGTRANPYGLTARQLEILGLLRDGLTDAEIAAALHISPKTVGHHASAIFAKLGVHSRRDAARKLSGPQDGETRPSTWGAAPDPAGPGPGQSPSGR